MIEGEIFEESVIVIFWVAAIFVSLVLGMRNNGQKQQLQGGVPRSGRTNGFIPNSFRAISSYWKIVSSGASTVARSAASVASSIVEKDDDDHHDQVIWAGFDKLEGDGHAIQQVLLLGYRSGFQVWEVEDSNNVRDLVSRHDSPVSFMQMVPKPIESKRSGDKFSDSRPLLAVCTDGFFAGGGNIQDGVATPSHGSMSSCRDQVNSYLPTTVQFYSLKSQSYVHVLKFRSVVYSVRCSSRVVAVSQSTQIHCFDATTLEREYTLLTNPVVASYPGSGGIGYGPLAVGPRWLAYSGCPVSSSNSGRVSPQHLTPSASFPGFSSNGSLVAHYAKESSKQLAAGIVTLGDMGYKRLSRYCTELLPDSNGSSQSVNSASKVNGTINGHSTDVANIGMVIVRDIVSKNVVAQFQAHKSPISAICFDPSGTLLVTASDQGHNINVFRIMPGQTEGGLGSDACLSYVHLYRLQRGLTNAVIQDISFSDDSNWIMVSSTRGTSHLFAINPHGGSVNIQYNDVSYTAKSSRLGVKTNQGARLPSSSGLQMPNRQSLCAGGPPITLSAISRIRNGNNGWRGTVSGAAAAATGRKSSISGAIASSFCNYKCGSFYVNENNSKTKYHLLVFSPTGCMIQYSLQTSSGQDLTVVTGLTPAYDSALEADARLIIEAIQEWNICQKHNRREREDNIDIYGENGISDCNKIYPEEVKEGNIASLKNTVVKAGHCPKEEHHLYISEAELQMHQVQTPIWAKPEIYFQAMVNEAADGETASGGEIEIETIRTHMMEARSKDPVPVFDYLETPKFHQTRSLDSKISERLLTKSSGVYQNGRIAPTSISTSLGGAVFNNDIGGTELHDNLVPAETKGLVNNIDSPRPNTQLEYVNNREHLNMEAQLMFVNNDKGGLKMENHFEDKDDEFD